MVIQTFIKKNPPELFRAGRRGSIYDFKLDSPWRSGINKVKYPYGGYEKYPIYGHYWDLSRRRGKYRAPHWYSSVTLAQQGLAGITPYRKAWT